MKKFLTLILVLCVASSANALLVNLDPTGAGPAAAGNSTIDVLSDSDDVSYSYFLSVPDVTYGDITGISITSAAGGDAAVTAFGDALGGGTNTFNINALDLVPADGPEDVATGIQFTADISFTGNAIGQDLTIQLLNDGLAVIDSYTLQGVPEPATMLLVGLGGVLLRRRKK